MESTRREHERLPAIINVNYKTAGALRADYAHNISEGGLFIATTEAFEQGQTLELHLGWAGSRQTIPVPAEVRWVDTQSDQPGIGVRFLLEDPAVRSRVETLVNAVFQPAPANASTGEVRILLADPNRHACEMFKQGILRMAEQVFELSGYFEVVDVYDGRAALDALNGAQFALAVVELRSPEVDGVELIRRIRTDISQSLPVFAISRPFPGDRQEALAAGADAYMHKPIQLQALFNTIRAMLNMQGDTSAAA